MSGIALFFTVIGIATVVAAFFDFMEEHDLT